MRFIRSSYNTPTIGYDENFQRYAPNNGKRSSREKSVEFLCNIWKRVSIHFKSKIIIRFRIARVLYYIRKEKHDPNMPTSSVHGLVANTITKSYVRLTDV